MNIFEKHPLPWKLTALDGIKLGWWIVQDANTIRVLPTPQIHEDEYLGFWREMIATLNALSGIENPVQWVADAKFTMEENASILKDAKRKIELLEAQIKNGWQIMSANSEAMQKQIVEENALRARIAELEQQVAKHPETIKAAISFFTMSNIPIKYVEKWMSSIDPTAPEEQ